MVKQAVRSLGLGLLFLIVTTSAAFGFAVYGAIGEKYAELGGERGPLGAPLSDEADAPYEGRFNRFQYGFIYWHPTTGAFGVWGKIGEKYQQIGGPAFGYPITDELATPDGVGRFNHFRAIHLPDAPEASIYWTPETGAQEVYGDIRKAWAAYYWERGPLGYPTSAEFQDGVVRRQDFQRGFIIWTAQHGAAVHTPEREAKCKTYAEQAVAQASEYFDRRCGQGDDRWQTNFQNHFGFCMGPHGDSMADKETKAREGTLSQCRTTNPPGGEQRGGTGDVCNVSAIVRNEECLNLDGTRSSLAPGSLSAEGCGVNRDAALEAAKAGFASQAAIADDPTPGACTYTEEVIAGCICR